MASLARTASGTRTEGSADAGQRVADEHVDDAGAAERRDQHDEPGRIGPDLADPFRVTPERDALRNAARAASASSAGTTATNLPSLAT